MVSIDDFFADAMFEILASGCNSFFTTAQPALGSLAKKRDNFLQKPPLQVTNTVPGFKFMWLVVGVLHSGQTRDAGTPNGVSVCYTWGPIFVILRWGSECILIPNSVFNMY